MEWISFSVRHMERVSRSAGFVMTTMIVQMDQMNWSVIPGSVRGIAGSVVMVRAGEGREGECDPYGCPRHCWKCRDGEGREGREEEDRGGEGGGGQGREEEGRGGRGSVIPGSVRGIAGSVVMVSWVVEGAGQGRES